MDSRYGERQKVNEMNELELFLQNTMKNRIGTIDEYLEYLQKYIDVTTDEALKSRTITQKRIFQWLKDLYELQNSTISSITSLKEWVSDLHRETLGNKEITIGQHEQAESLRDRFENTFGKLEKTIRKIQSQEEPINQGGHPYG